MYKKFFDAKTREEYYVGATADIKAMYKSIARNNFKGTNLYPLFGEPARFSENKSVYALCINTDENYITIVNSDTMMYLICMGEVVEA